MPENPIMFVGLLQNPFMKNMLYRFYHTSVYCNVVDNFNNKYWTIKLFAEIIQPSVRV